MFSLCKNQANYLHCIKAGFQNQPLLLTFNNFIHSGVRGNILWSKKKYLWSTRSKVDLLMITTTKYIQTNSVNLSCPTTVKLVFIGLSNILNYIKSTNQSMGSFI